MVATAQQEKTACHKINPNVIFQVDVENKADKGTKIYFVLQKHPLRSRLQITTKILTKNNT